MRMEYQIPVLEETLEVYATPTLIDVEDVASVTSGCYTAGFFGCSDAPAEDVEAT